MKWVGCSPKQWHKVMLSCCWWTCGPRLLRRACAPGLGAPGLGAVGHSPSCPSALSVRNRVPEVRRPEKAGNFASHDFFIGNESHSMSLIYSNTWRPSTGPLLQTRCRRHQLNMLRCPPRDDRPRHQFWSKIRQKEARLDLVSDWKNIWRENSSTLWRWGVPTHTVKMRSLDFFYLFLRKELSVYDRSYTYASSNFTWNASLIPFQRCLRDKICIPNVLPMAWSNISGETMGMVFSISSGVTGKATPPPKKNKITARCGMD